MAKYTSYFKPKIYCNINQKLAKEFPLHSEEKYPEPFQTSSYLFGGNSYFKARYISVLDHWKAFETTLERNQITYLQKALPYD